MRDMAVDEQLFARTYEAFNRRDIETIMAVMHPEVDWPNGWEGGRVFGPEAVRDYWKRQWSVVDPLVNPMGFSEDVEGRTVVDVRQVVRDRGGNVFIDERVEHVYTLEDGLIRRMEIRKPYSGAS